MSIISFIVHNLLTLLNSITEVLLSAFHRGRIEMQEES
jgi:hypothetical protein